MKVLLVEKRDIFRAGIENLLTCETDVETVATVSNTSEALERLERDRFDVALVDIDLLCEDDTPLVRRLIDLYPALAIVVLTLEPDDARFSASLAWAASGYLTKLATRGELVQAVRSVCAGGSYIQPRIANLVINAFRAEAPVPRSTSVEVSQREREVLELASQGHRNQDIANRLGISQSTVKTHFRSIYRKLDVSDRTHAVLTAVNRGLIQQSPDAFW